MVVGKSDHSLVGLCVYVSVCARVCMCVCVYVSQCAYVSVHVLCVSPLSRILITIADLTTGTASV